ncbi:sensor histidine kinase [Nocardioides sp.]|uniref:sensor histidine kinase n=1 Tax=Nocardioides sp. TaxID=35761 RepID=UPI00286BEEED|nr:sensor histidine kinase [Nocardioides sp.]
MRARQLYRLTMAARFFVLAAMTGPVIYSEDRVAMLTLPAFALLWAVMQVLTRRGRYNPLVSMFESLAVGALCGIALESTLGVLAAMAVPPFIAGLHRGLSGVAFSASAQLAAVVGVAYLVLDGDLTAEVSLGAFTWTVTSVGVGFVATFVRSTLLEDPDPVGPYRYAQSLLRELIDLSAGLSSGLDVNSMGGAILSGVRDQLPTEVLVLYVPRGETLIPLITESRDATEGFEDAERLAAESWARSVTVTEDRTFAFPLGDTAVVAGTLSERVDKALLSGIDDVVDSLAGRAVQFDTALLFTDFRDAATADERRRLAREMHDGIAQDIASLGYVVDALAARPASPEQAKQLAMLRDRISAVVAEVRQSVLTLRTSVGESESLGAAVGSVARHLSEVSGVPITVTLDEHTTRLRAEIEAELFRIAQEAMNNAVKHAQATSIDVVCQVYAPRARITVSDDGLGLQQARSDSHGLKIMRERAELISADLTITDNPHGGLTVSVEVGGSGALPSRPGSSTSTPTSDKVSA